jgi:hypothetical protein
VKKLISSLILFYSCIVSAQTLTPEEALLRSSKYPQERIYIDFDKAEYLAGETMHFRAYVFSKLQLSRISTNLYFELLDKNRKVIYKSQQPLYSGVSEGSYTIPKTTNEDVYYFRSYTSWMLNFDERLQFIKPINIYNPASSTKITEQASEWNATVHPEGGTLIDNNTLTSAVRLHSTGKLPTHITGYLYENSEPTKKLADIVFLNREIGSFSITPQLNKKYSIKVIDDKQVSHVTDLPQVQASGVQLSLSRSPLNINYKVTSKGMSGNYRIIAINQGEVIYSDVIKNGQATESIQLDPSTNGIIHIALFDATGNIAAERLCFVAPAVAAKSPALEFVQKPDAKKGLNLWWMPTDTLNNYTYTVKVAAEDAEQDGTNNFLQTFWLGELNTSLPLSDGYIDPANAAALDLLLMTGNWGKIKWNEFINKPMPKLQFAPDNYLTYQGMALYNKKMLPNKKLGLVIQVSDSSKAFLSVTTDNMGRFIMKNVEFRDTGKLFFRINDLEDASKSIDVELTRIDDSRPYALNLPSTNFIASKRNPGDAVSKKIQDYLAALNSSEEDDERYKKLEGVVIQAKARDLTKELNKTLSSPIFSEPGEIIFDFINKYTDETGSGVIDWLEGKVPGLSNENGVAYIRNQPAAVYINEFAADYNQLTSYNVTDIALVKILRNTFALGSSVPVIAIYTKTGNSFKPEDIIRIKNIKISGYPKLEKFRMVDYGDEKVSTTRNDTRNLLYWNTTWNPSMNRQQIKFYNNDVPGKKWVEIVGFSKEGLPVYLKKEIF